MKAPPLPLPGAAVSDGTVSLRAWVESDAPTVAAACSDPEIQRWTRIPADYREENAREYIDALDERRRRSQSLELAAADAVTGEVLGAMGLPRIAAEHDRAEVGYWTAPWARRRGVATGALRLLSAWAFEAIGLARLELVTATGNLISQGVAERAGYAREGVLRSYLSGRMGREDAVMFALLPGGGPRQTRASAPPQRSPVPPA